MYKILNQSDNGTELLLYSLIEGGQSAAKIIRQLKESTADEITLRINSDGGEVFDAIALYNYLKDRNVSVIIDGMCASAASIVAMSGRKIIMKQGSMMMIHNPLTFAIGDADDLRIQADILDKITDSLASIYAGRTGKSHEEILDLMKAETWMTADEALAAGFVDEIDSAQESPQDSHGEIINEKSTEIPAPSYEDGIAAERERIRALDELYAPGREVILNAAKYINFSTAEQAAVDILKAEKTKPPVMPLNAHDVKDLASHAVSAMAEYINSKRGY